MSSPPFPRAFRLMFLAPLGLFGLGDEGCSSDNFGADGGDAGDATSEFTLPPIDAGPDRYVRRFCQDVEASFCADFDIPNDAAAGFQVIVTPPSSVQFEGTDYTSPPMAMLSTAANVQTDASGYNEGTLSATIGQGDSGAALTIALELDIKLPPIPSSSPAIFAFLFAGVPPTPSTSFGLAAVGGQWKLINQDSSQSAPLTPQPPTGQWLHAQMVMQLRATNGAAVLVLTDQDAGVYMITVDPVPTIVSVASPPYHAVANIGTLFTMPPSAAMPFTFDNVIVRLQ